MSRVALRTPLTPVAGLFGLVVVLAFGMYAYDHGRRDQIVKGVRIDGIDVGGLSASAARTRLERSVAVSMERPVIVSLQGRSWRITPRHAGVAVDVAGTVAEAVNASRTGSIFSRTWRGIFGGSMNKNVPLQVSYSHGAVRSFVDQVRAAVDTLPRDATVEPGANGLTEVPGRVGVAVEQKRLRARVARALTGPSAKRTLTVPTLTREPAITTSELGAKYPAYIVINRANFELLFYDHLKLASSYPIAVGMQGLETTAGLYHIQWKQTDPPWYVPNSAWAGALAGKTIPPGPQDPLKARFMAFNGGAGIHGIDPSEYGTIGHDASHGCVRMRIPDVIALYARTPVGTPVYVI
ncbi:MAG TPA: L,D-transpeptidase/peptidoglycan binding protein [Solirubrobacteraceae bacterium]|nr:L,D-transpeptidase/peptidoglycan binding protein [Solirubrobacteraceae bacterium]